MPAEYSVEVCSRLRERFEAAHLHRSMRIDRYDSGAELTYEVEPVGSRGHHCRVRLVVEQFVGGGFAGQVYKVRLLSVEDYGGSVQNLRVGESYAMKILVPPSAFSHHFRNFLYWLGFQGPFQLQANPAAAKAGALWQKFIRRAAMIRFGDETAVADVYATFVDENIGSCGELIEWIDGRTWRLEVDDRMDVLRRWARGKPVDHQHLGSPEYRAKRGFMADFVSLLHEMGGHELARQYEWSTCKSQPNCLKRAGSNDNPAKGLVAVDFRAGLVLLPFLPMSPGDFRLIAKGIARGSLVQFDRGDIEKLEAYVQAHSESFAGMVPMLRQLRDADRLYRDSIPDITHNHIRLISSPRLWSTIFDSAVTGWRVRNLVDDTRERSLRQNRLFTFLFFLLGLIPLLGKVLRRLWGRQDWRRHYLAMLASGQYLRRAIEARITEKAVSWHRAGRINEQRAIRLPDRFLRFMGHLPLSVLPAGLHRLLTDWSFAKQRLYRLIVRPVHLYFNAQLREQWLRDMVSEGRKKHMLTDEDAGTILSQIDEPFIQKYLKSLAVHLCTLPMTEITAVLFSIIFVLTHPEMPRAQAWATGFGIVALFQIVPVSPGSLVRGFYVLYLVIRERNFRDYNIALFVGFFRYIGYLAFPIQMTYHYPVLARFMAAHWATEAVHIVPVFGERGALLEHWVFGLFYNWPLTIRRRMRRRAQFRACLRPRYWHIWPCAALAAGVFAVADYHHLTTAGGLPSIADFWWLTLFVPAILGGVVTLGAGGAQLSKRIVSAVVCGIITSIFASVGSVALGVGYAVPHGQAVSICIWRTFVVTIFATIAAGVVELALPEPWPAAGEPQSK